MSKAYIEDKIKYSIANKKKQSHTWLCRRNIMQVSEDMTFDSTNLENEIGIGTEYIAGIQNYNYVTSDDISGVVNDLYMCVFCKFESRFKSSLQRHIIDVHQRKNREIGDLQKCL